jgi:transcriptional regulator with XRE-family HTH domain
VSHEDAQPARLSGIRGRRQKPISGYGPEAQLARQLRELASAAELTFTEVAKRSGCAKATISAAASGRKLPTPTVLRLFVTACDVTDPDELREWDRRLCAANQALTAFRPELTSVTTVADLVARLATLLTEQLDPPLDPDTLSQRLAASAGRQVGRPRVATLPADEIAAVLDHRLTLTGRHLDNLLFAAGASAEDTAHWSGHLRRLTTDTRMPDGAPHVPPQPTTEGSTGSGPVTTVGPTALNPTALGQAALGQAALGQAALGQAALGQAAAYPAGGSATGPRPIVTALLAGEVLRVGELGRAARRRTLATVAVAAIATLLGAGVVVGERTWWSDDGRGSDQERPADTGPSGAEPPGVSGPADPGLSITARDKLANLADQVIRRSEPPQRGRFTYIHVRTWSRDTTQIGTGIEIPETRLDDRFWWTADGSGRRVYTTDRPKGPARSEVILDRGEWIPEPAPPPDPTAFRGQLAKQLRPGAEPVEWLRQAVSPYHDHVLNPAQRAAVLRLIAELPGLAYQGTRPDRIGRAGVAVSLDTPGEPGKPGTQDTITFDADTGAVLSHELVLLPEQPFAVGIDTGGGQMPSGLDSYVLFVAQGRTDRAG